MSEVNMETQPEVISDDKVYAGAVFDIRDRKIRLSDDMVVRRQVLVHPPVVVMLVHDVANDTYLLEREYRTGSNSFAYGIPAGFMDKGETAMVAALRELAEETGVIADEYAIRPVGSYYSSEGMSDELANIMIIDLLDYHTASKHFDKDEYVESKWVSFDDMNALPIRSSNSIIALQAERIHRLESSR